MERKQKSLRHSFEHQMLRDYYMKNPKAFVETLLEDPEVLFRMYDSVCRKYGEKNLYQPEQYSVKMMTAPDGTVALKLTMPTPEEAPECYRIYAFLAEADEVPGYFTIEHVQGHGPEGAVLCRWLKDRSWLHLSDDVDDDENEFLRCAEEFRTFDPVEFRRMLEEIKATTKPLSQEEVKKLLGPIPA